VEAESKIIVGVSDARISTDPQATLITYSLGSCIGLALFDPAVQMAGLLHFQLPSAAADPARGQEKPLMFGDSGAEQLIKSMEAHGAQRKRMKVKLAGASEMLNDTKAFNIGRRNHTAIRKFLWQQGMLIDAEDIGGPTPRTMSLNVSDGKVIIKADTRTTQL
jgi:chemotaxis protein CheD